MLLAMIRICATCTRLKKNETSNASTDICSQLGKDQVQIQNRLTKLAQQRLQRTLCHVPFRSIFPLKNIVPFRGLIRVATCWCLVGKIK